MIRRREKPDGLPYRVYERKGVRVYSIGYKTESGAWAFRLQCPADDLVQIAQLRRDAIKKAAELGEGLPADGTFGALADAWLKWQEKLPAGAPGKRADTTMAENTREVAALKRTFGPMLLAELVKSDAYVHLDACAQVGRAAKGNKEISLARTILERAVRAGRISTNPFDAVERLQTEKRDRLVTDGELALAVEIGRAMGGPQHIVALALRTAWLCVRRSVEVRALTRDQITADGIVWTAAKRQRGQAVKTALIEWSPALKATIDEALAIKRHKLAGAWYLFGNLDGQKYTKGGWKATLARLMVRCTEVAKERKIAFQPFSLQDCRPKGVTDKMARGDTDTTDATMHSSERMVRQVYDRRRVRVAKPAG